MKHFHGDIETLTRENSSYRKVLFTGKHSQLVLMSLKPGEEVGEEVHTVDQFFRVEQGVGIFVFDGDNVYIGRDGDAFVVPAGMKHNVINKSKTSALKFYTVYSPLNHPDKEVMKTKDDALKADAKALSKKS